MAAEAGGVTRSSHCADFRQGLAIHTIDLLSLFDKVVVHEVYSIFKSSFTRVQELILSSLVSSLIRDMEAKHLTPRSMSTLAQEWHLVTSHMVSREVSLSFIECH